MYLGIDLGTGTLKAALIDGDGVVVAAAEESYGAHFTTSGLADFDATAWWDVCVRVVQQVTASHAPDVKAVGLAGQMHGVVLVDREGRPVRDAILWPDHRAESVLHLFERFDEAHGGALGNPIVPGMAGPMLAWLAQNEPCTLNDAWRALQPKDWLRLQLCGPEAVTDPSDASATLLYDVGADRWSEAVCSAVDVDVSLLAPIEPSRRIVGSLVASVADLFGIRPVPVVVGSGDAAAALLGAGVERPGTALINIGTGGQVMTPMAAAASGRGIGPGIHQYRSASDVAPWYAMAAIANGGLALNWVRELVGYDWDRVYDLAGSVLEHGPSDPLFLPFLVGEREPSRDDLVGATWRGLTVAHDSDALVRSALRGVAIYLAQRAKALMDVSGVTQAVVSGGSTRHDGWVELLATVLGADVVIAPDIHLTVRGAARLAARGVGDDLPDPTEGARIVPKGNVHVAAQIERFDEATTRHFDTSG